MCYKSMLAEKGMLGHSHAYLLKVDNYLWVSANIESSRDNRFISCRLLLLYNLHVESRNV